MQGVQCCYKNWASLLYISFQFFIEVLASTRKYNNNGFFVLFNNGVGQLIVGFVIKDIVAIYAAKIAG